MRLVRFGSNSLCNMLKLNIKSVRNIAETQGCNEKSWPENDRHVNCGRLASAHARLGDSSLGESFDERETAEKICVWVALVFGKTPQQS